MKIYALTLLLLLHSSVVLAFGDLDMRTTEELRLLDEKELAYEAAKACSQHHLDMLAIRLGHSPSLDAGFYISRIGIVLMLKRMVPFPGWYTDIQNITLRKDSRTCSAPVFRLVEKEEEISFKKLRDAKAELKATLAKKKSTPASK